MVARVKLCAIAKNEGPYLADWVFHHLHLGFDAVEVWVNDTDDGSLRILRRIAESYPQVSARRADRLLAECLSARKNFQHRAYWRMEKQAREQGFSHLALLDLDEYWVPRDLGSRIHDWLPEDPEVNVVSFPWAVDVPHAARAPFAPPLAASVPLQLDKHVKSVVRLDDSVDKVLIHTAKTYGGRRLLVRDPFPLPDPRGQRWGSLVPPDVLAARWGALPEAFVLHAMNRSPREYLATLAKGSRQTGSDAEVKPNRFGYVPTEAPVLTFEPPARALRRYERDRRRFRDAVGVGELTADAERRALERAAALEQRLAADGALRGQLQVALQGLSTPSTTG